MSTKVTLDSRPFIDGRRCNGRSDERFEIRNPFNGEILAVAPACSSEDVDRAVQGARHAAADGCWSERSPAERAVVLRRLADLVENNGEELATLDTLQVGIPLTITREDIGLCARKLRDVANRVEVLSEQHLPGRNGFLHINERRPQGVVAAITPWNFPLFVAIGKIGPALATGNAVVLKPSEMAPLACLRLGDLASEAGLPPGALQILPGLGAQAGQALAQHRHVDMLSFTGSTATGRALMQASADSNLKALHLELGGKSPQVVLDDLGDMKALAQRLADAFTFNSGQVCVAGSRLLIHRRLASELIPLIAEAAAGQTPGDPMNPATTMGPMASPIQRQRVQGFIERARSSGYREHLSGQEWDAPFVKPRVFSEVPREAELMQEEVFGPVAAAITFDSPDEAVALANASRYGLAATVWGSNDGQVVAIARKIRCGHVSAHTSLNTGSSGVRGVEQEPFGESGFGVEGGDAGLLAFTRARHLAVSSPWR